MKEYDLNEFSQNNGRDGKPAFIAHQGRVIEVSGSRLWEGGLHMRRHHAGNDLTMDIQPAPHGMEVLERYPQVGVLRKREGFDMEIPRVLSWLLEKVPMLRRHPHPMTVHFPIVFMFSATIFNILYLITGIKSFELTALNCLGGGTLFTPIAISTGLYTWWLNYLSKPTKAVTIKKWTSITMFILGLIVFIWRIRVPHILDDFNVSSVIYLLLVLSFIPMVTIIGWFGAGLTFPVEKE